MEDVKEGKDYSFPEEELKVLQFWDDIDAFKEQLRRSEGKKPYVFYDGPPFATGLPHYGHLLAGTLKDVVTRYATATGHYCPRRFGWDCHGLPVEHEIDKKLGIKTRGDVLKMGIGKYNEECRSIVMRYSKEWEKTVKRIGRWIDFENDYKTLDPTFMESVWWVFSELFKKGLVYRGFKVMPYSTGLSTPLANFEANQNYKDTVDPSVMVAFDIDNDPDNAQIIAWTTTPWTLPSNLALCVNPGFTYVRARNPATGRVYVVAESRLAAVPGAVPKAGKKGAGGGDAKKGAAETSKGGDAKKGDAENTSKSGDGKKGAAPKEAAAEPKGWQVIGKVKGSDLVGTTYKPLFSYFASLKAPAGEPAANGVVSGDAAGAPAVNGHAGSAGGEEEEAAPPAGRGAFRVVADGYVTADNGTGVVHCAPAFGEDDMRVCLASGIIELGGEIPCPVDADGNFTEEVAEFSGRYVKDADKDIIAHLKAAGRLIDHANYMHSYPFCWRSDTPLIYKAVPSWFVRVTAFKDRLIAANAGTHWVPRAVKEGRFAGWLEAARDWCVSRSRFWGTPLPIWASEDGEELRVVGSIAELEELSGEKVTDLHRHFIDHLTLPSAEGRGRLRRVDEVFDCWFESGSMPYAQLHYPFENRAFFEANFPADFVAEGQDQTRGWFYTLMVLSTALFDKPAFRNLVCNGLVLADDGKKMSKRLKNYPDPADILDQYGADALRLYLVNSPVVHAQTLRFRADGVFGVVKDVFLPWYNAYRFLVQNVLRMEAETGERFQPSQVDLGAATNVLDRWIAAASRSLTAFVRAEMGAYRLYTVVPVLVAFIDSLTNVYVRYNRGRLKGRGGDARDCRLALASLFDVLLTVCKVMAPFTPFFCEALYQNLRRALPPDVPRSVHWCDFPEAAAAQAGDERIQASVGAMQRVIDLARQLRERRGRPLKQPLRSLVVVSADARMLADLDAELRTYVLEEVNVRELRTCSDPDQYATVRATAEFKVLGKRLGKEMAAVAKAVTAMTSAQIAEYERTGTVHVGGAQLHAGEIKVLRDFRAPEGMSPEDLDANGDGQVLAVLDLRTDDALQEAGTAREVINRVQKLRKKAGLLASDALDVYIGSCSSETRDSNASSGSGSSSAAGSREQHAAPPASAAAAAAPDISRVLESQSDYIAEVLGRRPRPLAARPPHAVMVARERHALGGQDGARCEFEVVLATPAVSCPADALLEAAGGDQARAQGLRAWLASRDLAGLQEDARKGGGTVRVNFDGQQVALEAGRHFVLPS